MMSLDRISPPPFADIKPFNLIKPEKLQATSGLTAFILEHGSQDVCRFEIAFPAGKWYEPYGGVSFFAAKLLAEGTQKHTSGSIQQFIAQHGAFLEVTPANDQVILSVFCLSRFLKPMRMLLEEMVEQPLFQEEEFKKLQIQARQNYLLNLNKTSYLANRAFLKLLFGPEHPYGRALDEGTIEKVSLDDLKKYHQHAFHWNQATIFACGQGREIGENVRQLLQAKNSSGPSLGFVNYKVDFPVSQTVEVKKDGAVQATLKAGFFVPDRKQDFFPAMYMYNEILGGYFGSRLMQNIREDKGFTYGIYSSMVQDKYVSYWSVQTDVNVENAQHTVQEIKKEMQKLQQEKVSEAELKIVKNYIMGSFISSLDTPFSFMDRFKASYFNELGEMYYEDLMHKLLEVTPEQIQQVAVNYFDPEKLNVVIAG